MIAQSADYYKILQVLMMPVRNDRCLTGAFVNCITGCESQSMAERMQAINAMRDQRCQRRNTEGYGRNLAGALPGADGAATKLLLCFIAADRKRGGFG